MGAIHVRWKFVLPAAAVILITALVYISSSHSEDLRMSIGYLQPDKVDKETVEDPDTFKPDFEHTVSKPKDYVGDTNKIDPMDDPPPRSDTRPLKAKPAKERPSSAEDGASKPLLKGLGETGEIAEVEKKPYPEIPAPDDPKPLTFRLYSHNIRNGNHRPLDVGELSWSNRRRMVISQMRLNAVPNTVFLLQEALKYQRDDVMRKINYDSPPDSPEWVAVGGGRLDGADEGEAVPVVYRPSEWELVFDETIWLNDIDIHKSYRGWDAKYPRIATVVTLKHRETGNYINVANAHLDHKGAEARRQSARLLRRHMEKINGWPSFIIGDMNSTPTDEAYKEFIWTFVDPAKYVSSYNSYGHPEYSVTGFSGKELLEGKRIDFIFAPKYLKRLSDKVCEKEPLYLQLKGYGLLHSKFGGEYMSDHRPVMADFSFGGCGGAIPLPEDDSELPEHEVPEPKESVRPKSGKASGKDSKTDSEGGAGAKTKTSSKKRPPPM